MHTNELLSTHDLILIANTKEELESKIEMWIEAPTQHNTVLKSTSQKKTTGIGRQEGQINITHENEQLMEAKYINYLGAIMENQWVSNEK